VGLCSLSFFDNSRNKSVASIRKRINKDGLVAYRVDVRLKGFSPQRATFRRLTDAKKWGQQTEAALREGRYFKTTEAKRHTLKEAIKRYKETVLPFKSDHKKQAAQLDWWHSKIGEYTLADITPAVLGEVRDSLAVGRSPATVNRYLAIISHLFTIAVNEWGWVEVNPVKKVRKPKEPRGRVRFLSDDERKELLKACKNSKNPYLYIVVVLALSTGMRRGEVLGLRWQDVDTINGRIILHETKNGERRAIPLTSHALELLKSHNKLRHLATDLLFSGKNPEKPILIRASWLSAVKEAKISDFRFHDIRHSTASYLAMNGATLIDIANILGHKTLQMVKRYAHLTEPHTTVVA
jgi:integrase